MATLPVIGHREPLSPRKSERVGRFLPVSQRCQVLYCTNLAKRPIQKALHHLPTSPRTNQSLPGVQCREGFVVARTEHIVAGSEAQGFPQRNPFDHSLDYSAWLKSAMPDNESTFFGRQGSIPYCMSFAAITCSMRLTCLALLVRWGGFSSSDAIF